MAVELERSKDSVATLSPPAEQRVLASIEELLEYYKSRGLTGENLEDAELTFLRALANYRFRPPAGKLIAERMHVMVFGGAGTGKSTVANVLVGQQVATVNSQAGFTRHPTAFFADESTSPAQLFPQKLGHLFRIDEREPADTDRDVYGWQRVADQGPANSFLRTHVVWDCPDLTTKDANHYQSRVLEIAGLADVGIYVASDERYNDELPSNFLQNMLDAGKIIIVVLTKPAESDAPELVRLFQSQVVARLRNAENIRDIVCIPSPRSGKIADLWNADSPYLQRLREAVSNATRDPNALRQASKLAAAEHFKSQLGKLLDPLRTDLGEWRSWIELVRQSANQAVLRFEREFLARVRYQELDASLESVLKTFEPWPSMEVVWRVLEYCRYPYRLVRGFLVGRLSTVFGVVIDEDHALDRVRQGIIESVRVGCSQRKTRHPLWSELHQSLQTDALRSIEPVYEDSRRKQIYEMSQLLQSTSRAIEQSVSKGPIFVAVLRVVRLLLDAAAIWASFAMFGWTIWSIICGLLLLGVVDDLIRLLCSRYVESYRAGIIKQQKEHIRDVIQRGYIDTLIALPPGTGRRLYKLSTLEERLQRDTAELVERLTPGVTA